MARRRMIAPIDDIWGEGQDAAETLAELQRMNEEARIKEGQDALNALNDPTRSQIQPGFARGNTTLYMGQGLPDAVRESQVRQNRLLGSALALSNLTGKTNVKTANAPPQAVNNRDPRSYRAGTPGAYEQQKRMNMALDFGDQRQGLAIKDIAEPGYHDRNWVTEIESDPYAEERDRQWAQYQKQRQREIETARDAANQQSPSGYARDAFGRAVNLPAPSPTEETGAQQYNRNYARNRNVIEEERRRRLLRGY